MKRVRLVVGLVGLVVAGVTLTGWKSVSDRSAPEEHPPEGVAAPGSPEPPPAAAFRVVYRVEDTAGAAPQAMTDVVTVRRPYEVRVEHRSGPPPGAEVVGATMVNGRYEYALGPGGAEDYGVELAPAIPSQSFAFSALHHAALSGSAGEVGDDAVLGERCVRFVYRQGGNAALVPGDDGQRIESCVTPDGILLREKVTIGGRRVRLAEAMELDRAPRLSPETFLTGRMPAHGGAFAQQQVVSDSKPEGDVKLLRIPVPPGFRLDRQATVQQLGGPGSAPRLMYRRAYVAGAEAVIAEQAVRRGERPPWLEEEGSPLDLGGGRTGRIVFHTGSVEVRLNVGGTPARVFAPRPDLALYLARTMTRAPALT
jgi:hypothetical protein